jgi:hypothetical protein
MMVDTMNANGAIGHAIGSLVSGGTFTIVSAPSIKNRADGGGIYRGPLQYTFAGGNASGFDPGSVATTVPQVIQPTAVKARADGQAVVRLGDSGVMAATGTVSGTPTAISGQVEVSDAGQDKVRSN